MAKKSTQATDTTSSTQEEQVQLEVTVSSFTPIINNVMESLNELNNVAPRAAFFARASILGSLGYAVCSQLIWANRRARARINEAAPDIDIFNDERADASVDVASKRNAFEQGMVELPDWDATPLAGVFKSMLAEQCGEALAKQYKPTMPHEIIRGIFANNNEAEIDSAYADMINREIGSSFAADAIRKAMGVLDTKLNDKQIADHKHEENAVLSHLRFVATDDLNDQAWETIPLFVQYRFAYAVYKQSLKAFAFLMKTNRRPDESATRLIKLIDSLTLELQAAGRTAEVQLAFDLERMGSTENIVQETKAIVVDERHPDFKPEPEAKMQQTLTPAVEMLVNGKIQKVRTRSAERV